MHNRTVQMTFALIHTHTHRAYTERKSRGNTYAQFPAKASPTPGRQCYHLPAGGLACKPNTISKHTHHLTSHQLWKHKKNNSKQQQQLKKKQKQTAKNKIINILGHPFPSSQTHTQTDEATYPTYINNVAHFITARTRFYCVSPVLPKWGKVIVLQVNAACLNSQIILPVCIYCVQMSQTVEIYVDCASSL